MTMAEYIEREATLWLVYSGKIITGDNSDKSARELIESIQAADVRPVVLCRDCMHAPSGTDDGEDRGFALEWPEDDDNPCPCKCEDGWYSYKPKPDFFCANGKAKEK